MRRSPVLALILGVSGCFGGSFSGHGSGPGDDTMGTADAGPGGNHNPGSPDATPPPPPSYAVGVDPLMASLTLGETKAFNITISGQNGFTGDVTLMAAGIPATWNVTFKPSATVTVDASGMATAEVDVQVPTDAMAGDAMLTVSAQASPGSEQAPTAAITVTPELVIHIPQNALNAATDAFGGTIPVHLVSPGTTITWINDDAVAHRIHADNINGFNHEPNDMAPAGGTYSVQVTGPGAYQYYCHIHPQMTGEIDVLP
jgi:plastocyanin